MPKPKPTPMSTETESETDEPVESKKVVEKPRSKSRQQKEKSVDDGAHLISEKAAEAAAAAEKSRPTQKSKVSDDVEDDAHSVSTSDILSVDHTFFVLSQFFMDDKSNNTDKKNITTILSEINDKLSTLITVLKGQ